MKLFLVALIAEVAVSLVVHMVAHTHDDIGWLKTPTQYYYGWNNSIQHANVQLIYASVVDALEKNNSRRFVVVEMAFFSKWFNEQTAEKQQVVRKLVTERQIEFAGGGWCSHDEATTHYLDILLQSSLGHDFILSTFGAEALPAIQWQVDPFGHSAGQVMLLSQDAGVTAHFFSRISFDDFATLQREQSREFFWMPSASLGAKAVVFASTMLHGTYCPPITFNFDILLNENNVVDRGCAEVGELNTAARCDDPQNTPVWWASHTHDSTNSDWSVTSGDVMWTMGCDFTHMQSETWFTNMERLERVASKSVNLWNTTFKYSTPQSYVDEKLMGIMLGKGDIQVLHNDFFPYADGPHMYWTGFYTSRPTFKQLVRQASQSYGVVAQINTLLFVKLGTVLDLTALREALAQSQHHDAITGTAKQHVSFDYTKTLVGALTNVLKQLTELLQKKIEGAPCYDPCLLVNESRCPTSTTTNPFHIIGWNSRSSMSRMLLRVPLRSQSWDWQISFADGLDRTVQSLVVPSPACVSDYAYDGNECAPYVALLQFDAVPMDAFAIRGTPSRHRQAHEPVLLTSAVVETSSVRMIFDPSSGLLLSIRNKLDGIEKNVSAVVCYYVGNTGDEASPQASGAYIFRPQSSVGCVPVWNGSTPAPLFVHSSSPEAGVVLDQTINDWLTLRWIILDDTANVQVEITIVELPIGVPPREEGRELVLRWITTVKSGNTFWTDSNGLELVARTRGENRFQTEPIAANYYPVVTAALIRDTSSEWMVAVDAAAGCSSLASGALECMVHRRLIVDDGRGVGEPLNETQFTAPYMNCEWCDGCCGRHSGSPMSLRRRFTVVLQSPSNNTWRSTTEDMYRQPLLLFGSGNADSSVQEVLQLLHSVVAWNASSLPPNVIVASLELGARHETYVSVFLRLSHLGSCTSELSCASFERTIQLDQLFPSLINVSRKTLTFTKPWCNTSRAVEAGATAGVWGHEWERPIGFLSHNRATMYPMEVHAYEVIVAA